MKAILKFNIDKNTEEAEKGLKKGITLGRRTSLTWHLYGIYQRSQKFDSKEMLMCRRYSDAKKAFQFAHTLDPKNIQVIIDLSELQIQVRDFAGYRTSKQKLINERGGNHAYWLGFMTGAYLDAKYDLCRDIISTFRDTLEDKPSYMRQELVFLETQCFMVEKKWREAIGVLEKGMKDVLNVDKAKEMLAVLYGYVGEKEKSEALWKELLDICEENYLYYRGLECCVLDLWNTFDSYKGMELPSGQKLLEDQRISLRSLYRDLQAKYPRSNAVSFIQLAFLEGEEFKEFLNRMIMKAVRKGVPSFFSCLKTLVKKNPAKLEVLKQLVIGHYDSLTSCGHLNEETEEEEPQVELWLLFLLAQIEDCEGHFEKALSYLEAALKHTPTCYDVYVVKAKVLRHAGDLVGAASAMGSGSQLDLGDRHMNTKHVKYLLRSDQIEEADKVVSYWTRKDVPSRIELNSLQANWFEVECGDSYCRKGDIPHAFKMYHNVLNHFNTYVDDQFDFHGYVMRKAVVTSYIEFLHDVDSLYKNKFYKRAAMGAIRCAISLAQNPINEVEYKKHYPLLHYPKVHKKGAEYRDDEDPDGLKLISGKEPEECARKAVEELLLYAKDDPECMKVVKEWEERKERN